MKKVILILAVVSVAAFAHAGQTFKSAVDYTTYLNGHYRTVDSLFNEVHVVFQTDYTDVPAIMNSIDVLKNQCFLSIEEIENASIFSDGDQLQLASIRLFKHFSKLDAVLVDWLAYLQNPDATAEQLAASYKIQDDYYDLLITLELNFDDERMEFEELNGIEL